MAHRFTLLFVLLVGSFSILFSQEKKVHKEPFPPTYYGISFSRLFDPIFPGLELSGNAMIRDYFGAGLYLNGYLTGVNRQDDYNEKGMTLGLFGNLYFDIDTWFIRGGELTVGLRQTINYAKADYEQEFWMDNQGFRQIFDTEQQLFRGGTYLVLGRVFSLKEIPLRFVMEGGYGYKYVLSRKYNIDTPGDSEPIVQEDLFNRTLFGADLIRAGFFNLKIEYSFNAY